MIANTTSSAVRAESGKYLLIRFSSLGDCILLCPLAERIKRAGAAEVAVLTKPAYAALFASATGVDRVIVYEPRRGLRGLLRLAGRLRGDDYRLIDAHNNWRSRLVSARLGGAQCRFAKHYSERFRLIAFKRPARLPTILEAYAQLAPPVARASAPLTPGGIDVGEPARRVATHLMGENGAALALAPGSRWVSKRWPVRFFAELSHRVIDEIGAPVVLVGDQDDRAMCARANFHPACINAMGQLDVVQTGGLLERCNMLVGNDSGLVHLSEAVGTPAVALFGPTVASFGYYPALDRSVSMERRLSCRPCSRNGSTPCPRNSVECLARIPVETVLHAAKSVLTGEQSSRRVVLG